MKSGKLNVFEQLMHLKSALFHLQVKGIRGAVWWARGVVGEGCGGRGVWWARGVFTTTSCPQWALLSAIASVYTHSCEATVTWLSPLSLHAVSHDYYARMTPRKTKGCLQIANCVVHFHFY